MQIRADLIPAAFKDAYSLWDKVYNGHIYMEICRGCYGLPQQTNSLKNNLPLTDTSNSLTHTPGLFKHITRPLQFSLAVEDFGIKYIGKQHLNHLITSIKCHYDVKIDYTGSVYCGITLDWHYDKGYLEISMPGYVTKQLTKYNHPLPNKPVNTPWEPYPIKYGNPIQQMLPQDDPPLKQATNQTHPANRWFFLLLRSSQRPHHTSCPQQICNTTIQCN
eukprot:CCRYP_014475-RA/>CCRYP_014475-RA protein AED:0.46 eAED:0.46 QI:0/0/0/1/0/0/2/0/218